ncbi:MAG: crossover junction endodeoxyribonuclease RuvC, partial [Selenomonadaceae bacterium]|nr:crossover junction endodeoxyribonuclease RuvC [Selenomonadaceae bacterium]
MLTLGIDPGTAIMGFGFVEAVGSRLTARAYGSVTTSPKARMQDRLMKLYDNLDALIKEYKPDIMGIE